MAAACAATATAALVQGLLDTVDCNVQAMTEAGYRSLSGPDSQVGTALTMLLTIYVAILGLRLLLGLAPLRIGDITLTALKLGVVLALATSWPTYQQVVFEALFHGPEQLAGSMMSTLQPPDAVLRGDPFDALQVAYDQMQIGAAFFNRVGLPGASPFTGGAAFAAFALNSASYLLLLATLGVVLATKIVLGLLLALGPVFIALMLFDSTRGVFEGWLRASIAFALAPLFATLALVVELLLIEPSLVELAKARLTSALDLPAATAVFLLTLISAMVCLAGLIGVGFIAAAFRLPAPLRAGRATAAEPGAAGAPPMFAATPDAPQPQGRAAAVAAAAAALERRDLRLAGEPVRRLSIGAAGRTDGAGEPRPLGQAYRRASQPRRTAASARRDQ